MRSILFYMMVLTLSSVICQNTETLRIPRSGDSCNVINLNVGLGDDSEDQIRGPQGRPGKRGSTGITGSKGDKGEKGEVGLVGITAEINMAKVTSVVLKALAATSCKELMEEHGISEAGYYQMRTNETNFATYNYCDFEIRNETTCEQLRTSLGNATKTGYYFLRDRNDFVHCTNFLPGDCKDVIRSEAKVSTAPGGVFDIYRTALSRAVEITCDLQTDGGGWTVFQKRMDGSVDFFRNWNDYVNGFGNKDKEFWLGLETIYQLTKDGNHELRVDLTDWSGRTAYAKYGIFSISSRDDNYRLTVGEYSGTAGNSLAQHSNHQFTTKDADHDPYGNNCAQMFKGAWWYHSCQDSSLNGLYNKESGSGTSGIVWYHWKNGWNYLKATEMKFRIKE